MHTTFRLDLELCLVDFPIHRTNRVAHSVFMFICLLKFCLFSGLEYKTEWPLLFACPPNAVWEKMSRFSALNLSTTIMFCFKFQNLYRSYVGSQTLLGSKDILQMLTLDINSIYLDYVGNE